MKYKEPFDGFWLFLITMLVLAGFALAFIFWAVDYNSKKTYSGTVSEIGYESNEGYYKHSGNPKYYILLLVDSINMAVRINVTVPLWSSMHKEDRVSFSLSRRELEEYGNGDKHLIK